MRPQRSADEGWGAHIRHQANASPSDQSQHENSSAELPRLPHDDAEKESAHSPRVVLLTRLRDISPIRDCHFEFDRSRIATSTQDVAENSSARPGAPSCAG